MDVLRTMLVQSLNFIISGKVWIFKKKTHTGWVVEFIKMTRTEFRADIYKIYVASGMQDHVLIQEYVKIAEAFTFDQKDFQPSDQKALMEKVSNGNT